MADSENRGPVDVGQVALGVAALVIAVWGLIGAPSLDDLSVLPWIAIGIAAVVGVGLVVSGGVHSRRR